MYVTFPFNIVHFQCNCITYIHTYMQGGSNMTGTDLCVNKRNQTRSYLNHLVHTYNICYQLVAQCLYCYELLLRHVSVTAVGHLQGGRKFVTCAAYVLNECGRNSTHQWPNVIKIKISESLKISLWLNTI